MGVAPEIPPEVLDAILDTLASDNETLQSCILVAKRWVARSRRHLFRHIHVQGQSSLDRFLKRVQVFGHGAHSLTLSQVLSERAYYKLAADAADLSSFTSLTWLSLRGIEFPTFHALAQLMASSPSLENILLVGVKWSDSDGERSTTIKRFPCLRQLYISCLHPEPIIDWFGCHGLPELHHVGITLCPAITPSQILAFLAKIPLAHLDVGPDNAPGFRSFVDLVSAKHGLVVHSTIYAENKDCTRYEVLRRPRPNVQTAPAHPLGTRMIHLTHTSIFCDLHFPESSSTEQYDWEGLDYIFTSSRFSTIQSFVLFSSSPLHERTVRNNLPMSNRRGVLAFSQMGK
ncbi:hypothetical protein FB45DRAFT_1050767 [Roridomyces roridus]|uniref:F-box domain-containing protein n=1 Tax=Roridomyces roridus TaxID=1738132 RepID=A0AAD7CK81_9AGAR|nr:hypothetical protein FB45DRAFT_1050767 [Roridomyces roridus]